MRHLKSGRKLKRTSTHRKALLKNLATSLFEHKKLFTTEAKAKELRPYAESLITKAKHALLREKNGELPQGQTVDIHNRRVVAKHIKTKAVLQELFDSIAPMVEERQGGYTRIIKTGTRRGDAGRTAIIELVDWSAPQDGAVSKKSKRKAAPKAKATAVKEVKAAKEKKNEAVLAETAPVEEASVAAIAEEPIVEVTETVETVETENTVSEEVADLAPETSEENDAQVTDENKEEEKA